MEDVARPPHALVATRDARALADLTFALAGAGYTLASATNASEAWLAVHERPADLLFVSDALAVAPPEDLLRRVRQDPTVRHVGVIVVRDGEGVRPPDASCDAVIDDPAATDVVLEVAAQVLRSVRARTGGASRRVECPIQLDGLVNAVVVRDTRLPVSPSELALLWLLLEHPRGVSDARLKLAIWGRQPPRFRGLVSVAHRLRRKLEPFGVALRRTPDFPGYAVRW